MVYKFTVKDLIQMLEHTNPDSPIWYETQRDKRDGLWLNITPNGVEISSC